MNTRRNKIYPVLLWAASLLFLGTYAEAQVNKEYCLTGGSNGTAFSLQLRTSTGAALTAPIPVSPTPSSNTSDIRQRIIDTINGLSFSNGSMITAGQAFTAPICPGWDTAMWTQSNFDFVLWLDGNAIATNQVSFNGTAIQLQTNRVAFEKRYCLNGVSLPVSFALTLVNPTSGTTIATTPPLTAQNTPNTSDLRNVVINGLNSLASTANLALTASPDFTDPICPGQDTAMRLSSAFDFVLQVNGLSVNPGPVPFSGTTIWLAACGETGNVLPTGAVQIVAAGPNAALACPSPASFGSLQSSPLTIGTQFRRGDCDTNGQLDAADALAVFALLFQLSASTALTCMDACDANDDGVIDLADGVTVAHALSAPGSPPPLPLSFGLCGSDPNLDALDCTAYGACP